MIEKKNKKKKSKLRENIEIILLAMVIAIFIRIFFIEGYRIPTQSLYPNLLVGDHLLVNKLIYGVKIPVINSKLPPISKPEKGDVFVFQNPKYKSPGVLLEILDLITFSIFGLDQDPIKNPKNYIKRCLGGPGDSVILMDNREIEINGELIGKEKLGNLNYRDNVSIAELLNNKNLTESEKEKLKQKSLPNWAKNAFPNVVELYEEKISDEKSYKVQYAYLDRGMEMFEIEETKRLYYMPKKGDILTINRKSPNSADLVYKIGEIDITSLWENISLQLGIRDTQLRGYKEVFEEESKKDLSTNRLLMETRNHSSFTYKIQYDYYFMLGDNRDNSEDGRFFGPVRENLIIGPPIIIYFPFTRIGSIK